MTSTHDPNDYMTFEQASTYLNTTRSTLYRWLREERVPAHKLGRQWRFLRHELDAFLRGDAPEASCAVLSPPQGLQATLTARLAARVTSHSPSPTEAIMHAHTNAHTQLPLHEQLIWDALDSGASAIHLRPDANQSWAMHYRTPSRMQHIDTLSGEQFEQLSTQLVFGAREARHGLAESPHPFLQTTLRRSSTLPGQLDLIQLNARHLQTVEGPRLTIRLIRELRVKLDDIMLDADERATLERWCAAPHGLVLCAGVPGSGKTSTVWACLNQIASARADAVIFAMNDTSLPSSGAPINQVLVNFDDLSGYRQTYQAVMDSDPDVVSIGSSGHGSAHHAHVWESALGAAQEGHLVFLQLEADDPDQAIERVHRALDRAIDDDLLGVCWQQLSRDEQTHRVTAVDYRIQSGPLDMP